MSKFNRLTILLTVTFVFIFAALGEQASNGSAEKFENNEFIACEGFKDVRAALKDESGEQSQKLQDIVLEFNRLQDERAEAKKTTYQEKLEEFQEAKAAGIPEDPNDIADAYSAIISCINYADEDQKQKLLDDEYIDKLAEKTNSDSLEQEAKGEWAEAYTNCFWLSRIYEDNKSYEDRCEQLLEKMTIEGSLTDSPCETSEQRFEGIEPVMFIRAVKLLDFGYVDLIDYDKMAGDAFERCIGVAEVLSFEKEDINVDFDKTKIQRWIAGIRKIRSELDAGPLARVNHKDLLEAFLDVLKLNKDTVSIPEEIVVHHFAEAGLATLDPYTNIVWPFYTKEFEKSITQEFTGIGIEISKNKGDLTVMSLLPGTPAYYSGLDAEDVIEAVDGVSTKNMTINCAVSHITGPEGTEVTLTVRGKDDVKTREVTIERAKIVVPTIRGWQRTEEAGWKYMLDEQEKIGYLRITGFTSSTVKYMKEALNQLEDKGLEGLIIDLRYNSGGLLQTAGDVVDMFVDKGMIVSTKPRWGFGEEIKATKKAIVPDYPIAVLINGGSASASEIVAGAFKDEKYERATLVGSRTYGKGSVQTVSQAPGGGAQIKYTMAFYHLPSGQPVKNRYLLKREDREDWGISPHIEIELTSKESTRYIEVQKDNDVLVKADHNYDEDEVERHSAEETIDSDPQLATALLAVKAKLAARQK